MWLALIVTETLSNNEFSRSGDWNNYINWLESVTSVLFKTWWINAHNLLFSRFIFSFNSGQDIVRAIATCNSGVP